MVTLLGIAACAGPSAQRSLNTIDGGDESLEKRFHARQKVEFAKHAKILMDEGRMPRDFGGVEMVLGRYGWHSRAGSSEGSQPALHVLRTTGGAFGAYSFYLPAFEQAKRSWWIHGVMEKGSDILRPVNRGAAFTTQCENWFSSTGEHSPPCVNKMQSPIGYKVAYVSAWEPDAEGKHVPVVDATVIDMPKYSDGSLMGTLRLDRKAQGFAMTYDIGILPPDYVDMCGCHQ